MTTRTARGCGRLQVTVRGEPLAVGRCHCDFCQKRTGSVFGISAVFGDDQLVEITGEVKVYNGLKIDGVGAGPYADAGVDYHFCPTCGLTLYWSSDAMPVLLMAAGNFVDPGFPAPTSEAYTQLRHDWVSPIPGAMQFETFPPALESRDKQ
jgi:hypothetical protein